MQAIGWVYAGFSQSVIAAARPREAAIMVRDEERMMVAKCEWRSSSADGIQEMLEMSGFSCGEIPARRALASSSDGVRLYTSVSCLSFQHCGQAMSECTMPLCISGTHRINSFPHIFSIKTRKTGAEKQKR